MESFSLLKYWRSGGVKATETSSRATTQTILTDASSVSNDSSEDEEGPYFDMEFAVPDDNDSENGIDDEEKDEKNESEHEIEQDEGEEVELTIESEHEDCNMPVSLQKTVTKFRVLLLKLKKSKSGNGIADKTGKDEGNDKMQEKQGKQSSKHFTVNLKVDEVKGPLVSFFTRDNSSKQNNLKEEDSSESNVASDEKKLSKEMVQKYLNMVKPTYIRVSKRYVEKLHLNFLGGDSKNVNVVPTTSEKAGEVVTSCVKTNLKQGNSNFQAGLKVVKKHLGKSRSASETVASPKPGKMALDRRDDSLLEVQDGIQGAILHCKRSFNGSDDVESSSVLSRSASDPSYENS